MNFYLFLQSIHSSERKKTAFFSREALFLSAFLHRVCGSQFTVTVALNTIIMTISISQAFLKRVRPLNCRRKDPLGHAETRTSGTQCTMRGFVEASLQESTCSAAFPYYTRVTQRPGATRRSSKGWLSPQMFAFRRKIPGTERARGAKRSQARALWTRYALGYTSTASPLVSPSPSPETPLPLPSAAAP